MMPGGIDKKLQAEIKKKESAMPKGKDHRNKKIYDVNSDEARKIMAGQKVQGYTPSFGYIEKAKLLELYIPVPNVSLCVICEACREILLWSEASRRKDTFVNTAMI